jgi:hypothetical protein
VKKHRFVADAIKSVLSALVVAKLREVGRVKPIACVRGIQHLLNIPGMGFVPADPLAPKFYRVFR